jgi:hypothetical protein
MDITSDVFVNHQFDAAFLLRAPRPISPSHFSRPTKVMRPRTLTLLFFPFACEHKR